jgi:hypothetical protein
VEDNVFPIARFVKDGVAEDLVDSGELKYGLEVFVSILNIRIEAEYLLGG